MNTTAIKERPILFSDQMVRALLDGSKTQTRRVITPQPTVPDEFCCFTTWNEEWSTHDSRDTDPAVVDEWTCPYGYPGTQLWVRECWTPDHSAFYPNFPVIYRADGYDPLKDQGLDPDHPGHVYSSEQKAWYPFKWRPSIFCPREHSRIQLEVVSIKAERVNAISEEDAIAEGMQRNCLMWNYPASARSCPACSGFELCQSRNEFIHAGLGEASEPVTAKEAFRYLWDKINSPRGFGWDANPWVLAIEVKRIKP